MNTLRNIQTILLALISVSGWAQRDWSADAATLSDGEFYIYSPKYNMFLGRGNDWGTRATLDYQGLTWEVKSTGEGTYTLKNISRDGHALGYLYIDQTDESAGWVYTNTTDLTKASTKWTIAPVEGLQDTYTIRSSQGYYLFRNDSGTIIDKVNTITTCDDRFYWCFVPKSVRESVAGASRENPVDVTYYIYDQNMDYYGGEAVDGGRGHWTSVNTNPNWKGGLGSNTCAEVWNSPLEAPAIHDQSR